MALPSDSPFQWGTEKWTVCARQTRQTLFVCLKGLVRFHKIHKNTQTQAAVDQ